MLSYLRHNWLAPLLMAVAFTIILTLVQGGFDAGRALVVFTGLFVVNYIVGLIIHLLVDRNSTRSR